MSDTHGIPGRGHDGIPPPEPGDVTRDGHGKGALASCPQTSWRRAALAAAGAAALALVVHSQALVTGPIPPETPGLELSSVPAVDLGAAGAPLAWLAHAAVAALVTIIALRLTGRLLAGIATGLLFAVHPLTIEAVAWSEARAVPVAFALSLGAAVLWFFVAESAKTSRSRVLVRIGAFALVIGGAMLHPMSAIAPVCMAAALAVMRHAKKLPDDTRAPLAWPIVVWGLVMLAAGTALHGGASAADPVPALAMPAALFESVASFVVIWRLMADYAALYTGAGTWTLAYGLVGLAAVFIVLERVLERRVPAVRATLTWTAIALILGMLVAGRGERHDWALYLMCIGLAGLLGSVIVLIERVLGVAGSAAGVAVATLALGSVSILHQGPAWRSPKDVLMLMKRVPVHAQLDFAERLVRMGGEMEKRAAGLDRRAKELERDGRDGVARETREESSRLRESAMWLFRRCSSALREAESTLAPDDARLLSTRGLVALRMDNYPGARDFLEQAVDGMPTGPERAEVLVRLGAAWEGIGDRSKAVECYEEAAKDAPDDPTPLVFMGMALSMRGHFPKALAALRRATELRPEDAKLQHRLGLIFVDMLMFKEAEAALLRAREADPSNERYRDELDTVRRLLKVRRDPAKAKESFDEGQSFEARAWELVTQGNRDEAYRLLISAADAYKRAIAYAQNNHSAHYRRGVCLATYGLSQKKYKARHGHLSEAINHFETALLYDKDNEDYLFELGKARQALGQTEKAAEIYRSLIRINRSSGRAHYGLAKLYAYQANDPSRARDELEKAKRLGFKPEAEFLENLEDIEFGPHTEKEIEAEDLAQSAKSEVDVLLKINRPAEGAAVWAKVYDALAGFKRPLLIRKRAGAAARAAGFWEHAKDLHRAHQWYAKAVELHPGPYDKDLTRVDKQLAEKGTTPSE